MTTYVTSAGLAIPSVETLLGEINADQKADVDPLLDTEPESPQGNINGIFASDLREAYEVLEVAYHAFDPDAAEGDALVNVCAITGTTPGAPTKSKFVGSRKVLIGLNAATTVPIGTIFAVAGDPSNRFVTTESVTSVLAGGYFVACEALTTGPIACNAFTLTVIVTPVVGLNTVGNPYDAIIGSNGDTDQQLRIRRERELRATGAGTVDAIGADLVAYTDDVGDKPIVDATIFENQTDIPDANGLPGHSLECLVYDGLAAAVPNDTIAQLIWNSRPGGIQLVGTAHGNAIDRKGVTRVVPFSRPTVIVNKFQMTLQIKASRYGGDTAVKNVIRDLFPLLVKPGGVIRCLDYVSALLETSDGVSGVLDVTNFQIGLFGGGYGANLVNYQLGLREMGSVDTALIGITTVPV